METKQNQQNTASAKVQIVPRKEPELKNPATFDEFILWFAVPRHEKIKIGLETQEAFATYHGLSERTMTRWKGRLDFYPRVQQLRNEWAKSRTSDVIASIYHTALKGNPLSQKLWMQVFEGFAEKQEVEHTVKAQLNVNDIRFILEQFPEELKEKYYGYIREIIDAAEGLRSAGQLENRAVNYEESESTILDETNHDAQDVPVARADGLAEGDTASIRPHLVRLISASDNQGTARWWKEQTSRDTWI